jgi:hypothetical protein
MKRELCIALRVHRRESLLQRSPRKSERSRKKRNPPALQEKTTFSKPGAEGPSTRRTPLSTSPTERWTRITKKKEVNKAKDRQAALSVPPSSKESRKRIVATTVPFYPDILFIGGRVESNLVSDAEIFGDITKPENRVRRNPYHETRSQRWEKL